MKKLLLFLGLFSVVAVCGGEPFEWGLKVEDGVAQIELNVAAENYVYADKLQITVETGTSVLAEPLSAPVPVVELDEVTGLDTAIFPAGEYIWRYRVPVDAVVTVDIAYSGCRKSVEGRPALCYIPARLTLRSDGALLPDTPSSLPDAAELNKFSVVRKSFGYMDAGEMVEFLSAGSEDSGGLSDKGFWVIVLLTLLGGLALNLTPCVLPLIPVNLAIIGAGVNASSRRAGILNGSIYALGMALTYGVLGLIAAFAGVRLGTLNTSWGFNVGVSLIFIVMALAMFGVLNVDFSRFGGRFNLNGWRRCRWLAVFLMGVLAALLAGACVAPVIASVLLLAAAGVAEGNYFAVLWPFLLGVGMALPWPLVGAGLSVLPRPGGWMRLVKWGFGLVIALLAVYYGWLGYSLMPQASSADAGYSLPAEVAKLNRALEESMLTGRPVFVDIWSTTCKNCLYMDETTFKYPQVQDKLKEYIPVKFQIEDFSAPAAVELLNALDSPGLPTVGILVPELSGR